MTDILKAINLKIFYIPIFKKADEGYWHLHCYIGNSPASSLWKYVN